MMNYVDIMTENEDETPNPKTKLDKFKLWTLTQRNSGQINAPTQA